MRAAAAIISIRKLFFSPACRELCAVEYLQKYGTSAVRKLENC